MLNTLVNKRYFIKEKISQGGLCDIYKASDIYDEYFGNKKFIVLKIPKKELLRKDDIEEFIYMEYKILRKLSNDNIVKVFDFGIDTYYNFPYLVLEFLDGILLSSVNKSNLNKIQKDEISNSLSNTLNYIHSKNIIHADISSNNIMIFEKRVVFFDFGVSLDLEDTLKLDYKANSFLNNFYSSSNIKSGNKPSFECDRYSLSLIIDEIYEC